MYNGPHTWGANIFNNGSLAWLSRMGRRSNPWDNNTSRNWGVRFRDSLVATDTGNWGPAEVAFMTCPSIYQTVQLLILEPHGSQGAASYNGIDYSSGQADGMWGTWQVLKFDRNYLYGDGHVSYIGASTRLDFP
jgi:prepilin-type processing-associated H-X9-DG protein